ncbi:bis-aminopropyl spermidine synthase family protein [Paenibacillus tianjinensis]|uniref:Bis-aminopropyl spermidine synthase family protein n=1 Tax=Paenibacillus tianjinensis TaxID=2810347 RepID=A0ABX7L5P6_9BACL|nr:bis-aminopropyl spermidine synthase family protein [Paenibacillus tianjinensis]QSF43403.1 bis-aminopropyl spermidine synthase family protein [Paenibacillus tianjinensis]
MVKEVGCIMNTPITRTTKEFIKSMKEWTELKKIDLQLYSLTHTYDEDPKRKLHILVPYDYETFNAICAYIQFECSELETSFSMDQTDIIEVLTKFYDCEECLYQKELLIDEDAKNIDLYINWESHCGSGVQEVKVLKRDVMNKYFEKYIESFYQEHPNWRP